MLSSSSSINRPAQVLFASLVGTTVEFFDFYIYAIAAALVFPKLFFPSADANAAQIYSYATFGVAFFARPIGSAIFGHFGDRIGRKRTLVVALSTMGLSTFIIGIVPGYATIGILAPLLLALCRFGQGVGLGGEWGGAVLLAVENAPPNRRALYGMFPQLGAPIGFSFSGGIFLFLSTHLTNEQFLRYGWRIPFIASSVLVLLGLYVRLTITETPVFQVAMKRAEPLKLPLGRIFTHYTGPLIAGTLACISTFVLFYLMTVFTLGYATTTLHYTRNSFLPMQLGSMFFFAITIPLSALIAEKSRRLVMFLATILIGLYGFVFAPLFQSGHTGAFWTLALGLGLMGMTYGPLGTIVSEVFPTAVRYTGSSLAFSLGGVLGASFTPNIATSLARSHGLKWVGYYLTASAVVTLIGLLFTRETRHDDLHALTPTEPAVA